VSAAAWCDWGEHAYKAHEKGSTVLGQNVPNPSPTRDAYGVVQNPLVQEVKEICATCAAGIGLYNEYEAPSSPEQRHRELMSAIKDIKGKGRSSG
jgi:hypothetical protein